MLLFLVPGHPIGKLSNPTVTCFYSSNHSIIFQYSDSMDFPGDSIRKESIYNAGDPGSILGSGRSLGEGNGNPLQCFCLGNSMDRGPGGLQSMGSQESDVT